MRHTEKKPIEGLKGLDISKWSGSALLGSGTAGKVYKVPIRSEDDLYHLMLGSGNDRSVLLFGLSVLFWVAGTTGLALLTMNFLSVVCGCVGGCCAIKFITKSVEYYHFRREVSESTEAMKAQAHSVFETLEKRALPYVIVKVIKEEWSARVEIDMATAVTDRLTMVEDLTGCKMISAYRGSSSDWSRLVFMPAGDDVLDLETYLRRGEAQSADQLKEKMSLARDLVEVVAQFHDKDLALLDIKSQNLLVNQGLVNQGDVKAHHVSSESRLKTSLIIGLACNVFLLFSIVEALIASNLSIAAVISIAGGVFLASMTVFALIGLCLDWKDQKKADEAESIKETGRSNNPSREGRLAHLKAIDLGLGAKLVSGASAQIIRPGTPIYGPPENVRGYSASTENMKKHDAWSMAVVLYEIFSGRSLYDIYRNDQDHSLYRRNFTWDNHEFQFHIKLAENIKSCANGLGCYEQQGSVPEPFKSYMLKCGQFASDDRKTVQEAHDEIREEKDRVTQRTEAARTIQGYFRTQKNLSQNGAPEEAVSEPGGAVQSGDRVKKEQGAIEQNIEPNAERSTAYVKKGFMKGCVAGVVLSAVGVIVALSLQTAKIITMNQIAVAGLNVGIGALNVLGASIGSVSTLGTAGTVAAFAGGIAFSMISIGVVLLVKRAVDRSPSSFRGSSQEEPIVVQASKDNFPASSLVTGGGSSAVRLIDENRRAHQETSNRPRQAGSSAGVQGAL